MALPVTISGISTAVACVGPFKANDVPVLGSQSVSAGTLNFGNTGQQKRAQAFTTSSALAVSSISMLLNKVGSPTDNVQVDIFSADGSGNPTGGSLGTSSTVSGSSMTATQGVASYHFTFSTPVSLSASTTYVFVISRTGSLDGTNYYAVTAGGTAALGAEHYWGGSSWTLDSVKSLTCGISDGSSAYYFFGRDGTTATTLQCFKATDPASSWASIGTDAGFTTAILALSGEQSNEVIHLALMDGTMASSVATKYVSFDTSVEVFTIATETAIAAAALTGQASSGWGCSLVVRSNSNVVAFYNSTQTKTSGTYRARVSYRERTGVNTWGTETRVDANTGVDNTIPEAALGASDTVHFLWIMGNMQQRALTSGNALQTAGSSTATLPNSVSYVDGATTKVVVLGINGSVVYFDSGNTPTLNTSNAPSAVSTAPAALFVDGVDVWAVGRNSADSDLYAVKSTDDGATWGTATDIFTGTVASATTNLSKDGNIYSRGSYNVIPYIVNDNGTLKYNEYQVSQVPIELTATSLVTAQAALGSPTLLQLLNLNAVSLGTATPYLTAVPAISKGSGMPQLTAVSLASAHAALGIPALTQKHVLTAISLASVQAALGAPAITQKHNLTATSLASAQDALGTPTLSPTSILTAISLATKQSALDAPALTQKHVLAATSLATQQAMLGAPVITQKHILAATSLASAQDALGAPVLLQTSVLTATSLASKQAALGSPAISQKHNLTATSLATAQAALGTPAIGQTHVLTATSLATKQDGFDAPTVNIGTISLTAVSLATQPAALGTPAITQGHVVTATSLATKQAALDAPAISQKHALTATSLATAQDALGAPTLAQTNVLAAISLATKQAALDSPAITQKHNLTAISLATAQAVLGAPAITQKHLLAATSLATAQDVLGTPTLTIGVINLTATSLATQQAAFGAPTLALKINFTASSLATAQAGLDTPAIGQKHVLNATSLATAQAALGTPAFTQGIIRVPATRDASLSGSAPTVTLPANIDLTPPQADLALLPTAPIMSGAINRVPDTRDLGLSPTAPTVTRTDNHAVTPDSRDLTLSKVAPVVFNSFHHPITVPQANIALSSLPPQTLPGSYVYPNPDQLAISTTPPIITRARLHHWRTPSTARATLNGKTNLRGNVELTP